MQKVKHDFYLVNKKRLSGNVYKIQNCFTLFDSNQFKVNRLQIIVVAKNISMCHNCSSVGCLKCVQFHNLVSPPLNPIPIVQH